MLVPDYMPVLSEGAHDDPSDGGCVMEYVSFLAGEEWSDSPVCTHPVLAAAARQVNDCLPDQERQRLLDLLPRLMGTDVGATDKRVAVQLAVFAAGRVEHLVGPQSRAALEAARGWLRGEVSEAECTAAGQVAASAANYAAAYAAAYADGDAGDGAAACGAAANSAGAFSGLGAASAASVGAVRAGEANDEEDLIAYLSDLIDEYDRITGRTTHPEVTADDLRRLAALTTA